MSEQKFFLRVKLSSAFQEGVGEFYDLTTPVQTLGELAEILERDLPAFENDYDSAYSFAVNGQLILHKQKQTPIKSGDEIEVMVAFSGG